MPPAVAAKAYPAPTPAQLARDLGALARDLATLEAEAQLQAALTGPLAGQIALLSSFGAEAAVLLHLVARIDPAAPVLFLDTGKMFPQTLAYRQSLAQHLGLTNVTDLRPTPHQLAEADPQGALWLHNPDACCALRKVAPLDTGLLPFAGWINGRKRFHSATRAALPTAEIDETGRLKLTPLANWTPQALADHITTHNLPRHPLLSQGYPSIGCQPCTAPVSGPAPPPDAQSPNPRAGRWPGLPKSECGIHSRPANA